MNILFLSRWFPFPPDNGSKLRIYHLLKGLSQFHTVTLLSFSDRPVPSPERMRQYEISSETQVVPWAEFNGKSMKSRLGFFSPTPRSLVDTYSPQMESLIRAALKKKNFDIVIASQLSMASYFSCFRNVPALFEEIELGALYEQVLKEHHLLKRLRYYLSWLKFRRYLSHLLDNFQSGTVVSQVESRILEGNLPKNGKVEVLPNCVDLRDYQNVTVHKKNNHIVFSGSFTYRPNHHAMQWFIQHVFPLVLREVPDAHLLITGDHAGLPIPNMRNVTLAGYVDDIRPLIASCDVSIAPIWSGGGTRLKILEAMAIGTAVVATSKGAEGLDVENGKHILIADEPRRFAEHVIELLRDRDLRKYISSNAARLVKDSYDWQVIMPRFLRLVEKTAAG